MWINMNPEIEGFKSVQLLFKKPKFFRILDSSADYVFFQKNVN